MEIPIHEYVICTVNIPQIQRIIEKFSFPQQFSLDFIKTGYFFKLIANGSRNNDTSPNVFLCRIQNSLNRNFVSIQIFKNQFLIPHINNFKKLINVPYDVFANIKLKII